MTVTTEKLEASKKLARDYIDQVFNKHNPAKAADFVPATSSGMAGPSATSRARRTWPGS